MAAPEVQPEGSFEVMADEVIKTANSAQAAQTASGKQTIDNITAQLLQGGVAALNQLMRTLSIECRRSHPGLCITSIHPGTTNTGLSRPFQANVKTGKLYTPEQSARRILRVVGKSAAEQSGQFVNWDGEPIMP